MSDPMSNNHAKSLSPQTDSMGAQALLEGLVTSAENQFALSLQVNGKAISVHVSPDTALVDLLRQTLGLTGTNQGCDTAQCGACTTLVDGQAIKSCNVLALQMQGRSVTTIEGLVFLEASTEHHFKVSHDSILDQQLTSGKPSTLNNHLHIMQQAFLDHGALQCGYCTPGMIMRAVSLVDEKIPIDPHAIAHALGGNLCRCTGYSGIVLAVMQGLRVLRNEVES